MTTLFTPTPETFIAVQFSDTMAQLKDDIDANMVGLTLVVPSPEDSTVAVVVSRPLGQAREMHPGDWICMRFGNLEVHPDSEMGYPGPFSVFAPPTP